MQTTNLWYSHVATVYLLYSEAEVATLLNYC
jgi:hypothetical protein